MSGWCLVDKLDGFIGDRDCCGVACCLKEAILFFLSFFLQVTGSRTYLRVLWSVTAGAMNVDVEEGGCV